MRRSIAPGFTLIEVMVVIALIGILLTLALPSLSKRLTHHRLLASAEHLAQDIAQARHESAKNGLALHINFSAGATQWCYAVTRSEGCGCASAEPCQIKTVRSADLPGIQLSQARNIRFDPAVADTVAGGADLTSREGETLRVALSPLGRARICTLSGVSGPGAHASC